MDNIDRLGNMLQNSVFKYKKEAKAKGVQLAQVQGSSVLLNGRSYPFDAAVNVRVKTGEYVYVALSADGRQAVIVGR